MISQMTAAVLYGKEDLRLERVAVPQAAPGELVVQVRCRAHLWDRPQGLPPWLPRHDAASRRSPLDTNWPEWSPKWAPGLPTSARGTVSWPSTRPPATSASSARHGQQNLCEDLLFNNGAYAEYIRIPARIVEKNTLLIPDGVPLRTCCAHRTAGLRRSRSRGERSPPRRHHDRHRRGSHRAHVHARR